MNSSSSIFRSLRSRWTSAQGEFWTCLPSGPVLRAFWHGVLLTQPHGSPTADRWSQAVSLCDSEHRQCAHSGVLHPRRVEPVHGRPASRGPVDGGVIQWPADGARTQRRERSFALAKSDWIVVHLIKGGITWKRFPFFVFLWKKRASCILHSLHIKWNSLRFLFNCLNSCLTQFFFLKAIIPG